MSDRLEPYRAKRSASHTPEPMGRRFVIQEHSATRLHWDLRLERDGVLVSWAVPNGLPEAPKDNRLAVHTEDHPLEYLDFHGDIPRGEYGAGTMVIWDQGTYEELKWEPRKVEVRLHGERLQGRYALFPIDKDAEPKNWMIHRMDPPADASAQPMPDTLAPMLARPGSLPRDPAGWAFEVKWDGVRAICRSEPGRLSLRSRALNDITARYPELSRLNRALHHHRAILDGEVVALDAAGRPDFGTLQRRMHVGSESAVRRLARELPVTYMVFDLLWLDGHPLTDRSYADRRAALDALELGAGEHWRVPEHVVDDGAALLAATGEQGLEGIVAKRLDSTYEPGRRSTAWLKIKHVDREELVVGGWMPGDGRRRDRIGALLVGVREDDGSLRYAGRVGTGFTEGELDRLSALLEPLGRDTSPFAGAGTRPPRGAVFAEPELVAEVEFREWTKTGQLRAPSYKGLREDKPAAIALHGEGGRRPTAVVDGRELRLSNLDKLLYPAAGFAKRDVIAYYDGVAPVLLAHLDGRPLTLKRYPNGVDGAFFYEKNAPSHRPDWVTTARVGEIDHVVVDGRATLAWLANLADLELHTPMALAAHPERPTMIVFDLDPGAPATVVECAQVALLLRGMFEGLGLRSCVKTSGSKGLQVYLPLNAPDVTFAQTKAFARAVAELLAREEPELVVANQAKAHRRGRVLIDWAQNEHSKTTVTVYSLRATDRPTVSTPLRWEELEDVRDAEQLRFESAAVLARVREHGDLFADALSVVQRLPAA